MQRLAFASGMLESNTLKEQEQKHEEGKRVKESSLPHSSLSRPKMMAVPRRIVRGKHTHISYRLQINRFRFRPVQRNKNGWGLGMQNKAGGMFRIYALGEHAYLTGLPQNQVNNPIALHPHVRKHLIYCPPPLNKKKT